jgi:hypothetical protein
MLSHRRRVVTVLRRLTLLSLLILTVALSPQAVQAADAAWRGEYFNNPNLSGAPVFARPDSDINFDWGLGSPGAGIPVDYFSVRWTRSVAFPAGNWRFNATADDGVRVFVDGQLIIDQWHISAPATYSANILLGSGDHDLRVEYFENTERAQVRVWWDQGNSPPPPPQPQPDQPGWRGEYYDNPNLAGNPRFVRTDPVIGFDWGRNGPGGGIGPDNFSVRWTRSLNFDARNYEFTVRVDDGARLWLDGALLIDEWHESSPVTYRSRLNVSGGGHNMRLEYLQRGGGALVELRWSHTDIQLVGNLFTCMAPENSWIKVYRQLPGGAWEDLKPAGWGPINKAGTIKIDGIRIDPAYGSAGQPLRVELYMNGGMVQSVGNTGAGQPSFRLMPGADLQTPWKCGAFLNHFTDQ